MRLGNTLKENFAKNLQNLRTRSDLTQAKLAEELNDQYKSFDIDLQRTSIVNYESGGAMPRIDALYCIADYFGKTIDQMISPSLDTPEMSVQPEKKEGAGPVTNPFAERSPIEGIGLMPSMETDDILRTCVNGITYRHFFTDFFKKLYIKLKEDAATPEDREKFEQTFYRTYLASYLSKSEYLRKTAVEHLTQQEREVFMAFENEGITLDMVAKGQGLSNEEVISIFNQARIKISSQLEKNSKPGTP